MSIFFHPTTKRVSLWVLVITLFLFPITSAFAAQVTLAWDPNNPVPDGYRVYARVEGQNYDFTSPVWPGQGDDATQTSCILDNLADGTTYYFVVRAYEGTTESGNSNEVQHITNPATPVLYTISTAAGAHGSVSPNSATVASVCR
ncbi:MAG: fibronectin type III domain-containing protein [Desulfobacteraceae bacterium]